METFSLKATQRELTGRKTDTLRTEGLVPAIVYGIGSEPKMITVEKVEFNRLYSEAGESSIVELAIEGSDVENVLIQDVQRDPLHGEVVHVDLRRIDMNKPVEASVSLEFVGESIAVKALGGTLVRAVEVIDIRCLPSKLVSSIEVDISKLETFDDVIHVSSLAIPEGIEVLTDMERTIATVNPPRVEEVPTEAPEDELPEGVAEEGSDDESSDEGGSKEEATEASEE